MPLRTRGYGTRQRAADATMRVSDADRAEVADQLAQHYGEGRLDQAELDERLGRAMSAKTHADLAGLTADLPHLDTRPSRRPRQRPRACAAIAGRAAAIQAAADPAARRGRLRGLARGGAVLLGARLALARTVVRFRVVAVDRAAGVLLAALRPPAPPVAGAASGASCPRAAGPCSRCGGRGPAACPRAWPGPGPPGSCGPRRPGRPGGAAAAAAGPPSGPRP